MRRPDDGADLAERGNVLVTRLDVTEHASVDQAVEATLARFGRIAALVNNAPRWPGATRSGTRRSSRR